MLYSTAYMGSWDDGPAERSMPAMLDPQPDPDNAGVGNQQPCFCNCKTPTENEGPFSWPGREELKKLADEAIDNWKEEI